MIQLSTEFKNQVFEALLAQRKNFQGSDEKFAKSLNINKSVYSRLKKGERTHLLSDTQWINIGKELGVNFNKKGLKITRTDVLTQIEEEVLFCKKYSKAMMFVDDSEIGKTVAAKHLALTLPNCFYIDGSRAKTAHIFIRKLAKTIGLDNKGKLADVKENIIYYLRLITEPVILIDDGGDLKAETFLELKELWNGTENVCGWYMLGDDSLESCITKAITSKRPGFRAFFSRYSSNYSRITPPEQNEKLLFYKKLIETVLTANMSDRGSINRIVNKCIRKDENGHIGGLRRAESLLILNTQ